MMPSECVTSPWTLAFLDLKIRMDVSKVGSIACLAHVIRVLCRLEFVTNSLGDDVQYCCCVAPCSPNSCRVTVPIWRTMDDRRKCSLADGIYKVPSYSIHALLFLHPC